MASKQSWDDVDLEILGAERLDQGHQAPFGLVREGDDHAGDLVPVDDLVELVCSTENGERSEVFAAFFGVVVDEADDLESVFGMSEELLRDQLADVACAQDDRLLAIGAPAPNECTAGNTGQCDRGDGSGPEDRQPLRVQLFQPDRDRSTLIQPGKQGDDDEYPDEVVGARIVGPLLVSVVET
jgi:hypothetical protein